MLATWNAMCHIEMGMTLKIDRAGRVILPKPVRDRLGLHAGSDLEILETKEGRTAQAG